MWPFSLTRHFKDGQHYDRVIADLRRAVIAQDTPAVQQALESYLARGDGYPNGVGHRGLEPLIDAVFGVDRYDMAASLAIAGWSLQHLDENNKCRIADLMLQLCRVPGRSDAPTLAGICSGALAICQTRLGDGYDRAAVSLWTRTFRDLRGRDRDLAFATAMEAGLCKQSRNLRDAAMDEWRDMVDELAKRDPQAAKAEAERAHSHCTAAGAGGEIFASRARRMTARLDGPA